MSQASFHFSLRTAAVLAALSLLSPAAGGQDSGQAGWLRVYGVKAEEMQVLKGTPFMAGYLVGTSVAAAADGNFLVAGYVKAYTDHPVDLAVLKIDPAGTILWYKEYAPPKGRAPGGPTFPRDQCGWAVLTPLNDSGALVAFGSVVLHIDKNGRPLEGLELRPAGSAGAKGGSSFLLKNLISLGDRGFAVAGVYTPPSQAQKFASIFAARIDSAGKIVWAQNYPGLQPCEQPSLLVSPTGAWIIGSEPKAIAGINPKTGAVLWAWTVFHQPYQRGLKERPDIGRLLHYRSLGLASNGDIIFSGIYDLSWSTYSAPAALLARMNPDASGFKWIERVHSPAHGGFSAVNVVKAVGEDFYLVGTSTEFGSSDIYMNNNVLAAKMSGNGALQWIRSIGKKKLSTAESEYCNEMGNAAALTADGGLILAGASNSFAHPDPGFHMVVRWTEMHYDLVLARIAPGGGIANLPAGRYPRILSIADPGDPKKVDVVNLPMGVQRFDPESEELKVETNDPAYSALTGEIQTQITTSGTGGLTDSLTPVADFKLLPPPSEGSPRVLFDATISKASEGATIKRYDWTFGDGKTGTSAKTWHQYANANSWTVGLTVVDSKGREASVTKQVVVGNVVRTKGIPPAFASGTKADYTIEVLTGDVEDAGTNANVFIALYGKEDANGQRYASGDMFLSPDYESPKSTDMFERGQTNSFLIKDQWSLDEVDHMILRHDNLPEKPGWYIQGVKITNSATKEEWVFVPDQWLADDEGPDNRTWGKFTPVEPYPAGILLKGKTTSHGLSAASDNIVILEDGLTEFYFTTCEKGWFTQVFYSSGVLLGSGSTDGSGPIVFPYLKKEQWGVKCETSKVAKPESFKVKIGDKETLVWVFPKDWKGYEKEARRIALLYPLRNQTSVFGYADKAKSFLLAQIDAWTLESALLPILDYGMAALGIFGDIPDERLSWYLESNTEKYTQYKVLKVAAKLLNIVETDLKPIVSEFFSLIDTLWKAQNWAERLPDVIGISANDVNANDLLKQLANNGQNFNQFIYVFTGLKTKFDALVTAVGANNPSTARSLIEDLRDIAVGTQPKSESQASHLINYGDYGISRFGSDTAHDYPLSLLIVLELNNIRGWRDGGHPYLNSAWSKERSDMRKTLKYYEPPWNPVDATRQALSSYAPIIENIANIASIFIDTALCVDDKDPQWMN
ncbi:MAG: PKD domain-containing protein [Candidatus Aminicenantes bacterium]|nr:PKD domain-containing protein [Candidatus Aminicenantes bacterium]